jgi:hypothetical protein
VLQFGVPWSEQYFTNGTKSFRLYVRGWKVGESADNERLWRACIQPVSYGMVLAEQVSEFVWMEDTQTIKWAKNKLGKSFKPCTKSDTKKLG